MPIITYYEFNNDERNFIVSMFESQPECGGKFVAQGSVLESARNFSRWLGILNAKNFKICERSKREVPNCSSMIKPS
jgi:hypothetical protein